MSPVSVGRRPSFLVLVAVLLGLAASPVRADPLSWSTQPQQLSAGDQNASAPVVATSAGGEAAAAWVRADGGNARIYVALRPAGGSFAPAVAVSPANVSASSPAIAMAPDGRALVTWSDTSAGGPAVQAAFRPAGGTFGGAARLTPSGDRARRPAVAMDPGGNAVVVWISDGGAGGDRLEARYRAADGTLGGIQSNIYSAGPGVTEPGVIQGLSLAIDAQGNALAAWTSNPAPFNQDRFEAEVHAAQRPAGPSSSFGAEAQLASRGAPDYPRLLTGVQATITGGNAQVSWSREDAGTSRADYAQRAAGQATWSATQTLDGDTSNPLNAAFGTQTVSDPLGNLLTTWTRGDTAGVFQSYRPAGGSYGPPTPASPAGERAGNGPMGVDGNGNVVALWRRVGEPRWLSTYRPAGANATFEAPTPRFAYDGFPALAVAADGQVTAVWTQTVNDPVTGPNSQIMSAFASPPTQPPPPVEPPPPPPPPTLVSAIQPARPIKAGEATVLQVAVAGPVTSLTWDLPGSNPDVTGTVVDGRLQTSVRFRAPVGSYEVSVTARGPSGSQTFRRTLVGLRPGPGTRSFGGARAAVTPAVFDKVARAVDAARKPPVVAVGVPDVLAGKTTACGPTTVLSGSQVLSGCLNAIESMVGIPSRERGVLDSLGRQLRLDPTDAAVMNETIAQVDGYIATGTSYLNGSWPVVPGSAAKLLNFPQAKTLFSSRAGFRVAGTTLGPPAGTALNFVLDPARRSIPLGTLPKPPKLPRIGGFELVGDWNVDLQTGTATVKASIKLPDFITNAGIQVQSAVTLRATPNELKVEDVSVGPIKVNLGGLDVNGFRISYSKAEDTWQGVGRACLATGLCLSMVPPDGQIKIKQGRLDFAGATVVFPPPGVPLFTGVNLEQLGFGIGLDPTRLTGSGRIAVGRIAKLDGRLVVAFPSERTPFVLRADEVGGGFPAHLMNTRFTRPTIGATAGLVVSFPRIGDLGLGNGYFLYQYPHYIAVGGGMNVNVLDVVRISGGVAGEANFRDEVVNLHGDIRGCLLVVREICGGAVGNVSRGPNSSGGAGACVEIGPLHVGGGIQWARPTDPFIWPFDGCKWSPFKLDVAATRAQAGGRAPAGPQRIVVRRGEPSPAIRLHGQGGAPQVRVTGPGGQALSSTDNGLDASPGGKIRILRYQGPSTSFTVVGLQDARPGVYTVTPQEGSAPVTTVGRTTDLPDAQASGRVSGRGTQRTLRYRIARRPGQQVRFFDVGEGGAAQEIGHVKGGGAGTVRFSAAPGKQRRRIEAQFELQGLPAERRTVARYQPAAPGLSVPRDLRVTRRKGRLTVRWRRVDQATRYELAVTSPTGYQRFATTRRNRLVVTAVPAAASGRVTVRAVDRFRQGRVAARTFKRTASPASSFRTAKRCTVGRKKITCRPSKPSGRRS